MNFRHFLALVLSALLSSNLSFASSLGDLEDVFNQLKDSGAKYQITGTVCEQVARLQMALDYPPPSYSITTGVVYSDRTHVIGELDVVVFRNSDDSAILVGEVKCWKKLSGAHKKAREQLKRFDDWIGRAAEKLFFYSKDERFSVSQFENVEQLISISQDGGEKAGFDVTLEFTLDELMKLRKWLMACQEAGECRRPD